MRVLVDTHALIWYVLGDRAKLSGPAIGALAALQNELYVSAASAWEIATKVRLGKMAPIPGLTGGSFAQNVRALGFRLASITIDDAQIAGELPVPHRDPFDRMLLAQAQRLGALVTNERPLFASFGLPVTLIW